MTRGLGRHLAAWAAAILGLAVLAMFASGVAGAPPPLVVSWGLTLLLAGLAVFFARTAVVQRRRYQEAVLESAARQAVQQDRLRIAGDLHDVISHGLGAITQRARAGQALAERDPSAAVAALADIGTLSHSATTDLRGLLSVLRDPDSPAPTSPSPSLDDLPRLVSAAEERGLDVTLCAEDVSTASPGIQLTAAHVVREGLDNALRHAGPTRVLVEVRRGAGDLVVTVTDAGPVADWSPSPGAGHGLTLLAERVRSHGGVLRAEPHGPGHRVRAVLPMDAG